MTIEEVQNSHIETLLWWLKVIFYHLTKVKINQEKLNLGKRKKQSLKSWGTKRSVIAELGRATADSSKEWDNIVPEIKIFSSPKKLVLQIHLVSERLYTVHVGEGYKYLIPHFNIVMKWQNINSRYNTYMRNPHFFWWSSLVIWVLGSIFILNHTSYPRICQSRIPHSEM